MLPTPFTTDNRLVLSARPTRKHTPLLQRNQTLLAAWLSAKRAASKSPHHLIWLFLNTGGQDPSEQIPNAKSATTISKHICQKSWRKITGSSARSLNRAEPLTQTSITAAVEDGTDMKKSDRTKFMLFCQQATTNQLQNIIDREKGANRLAYAKIAERELERR